MTYHGIVSNGIVVIEGEKPAEGTVVEIVPVNPTRDELQNDPAFGIWRDRTDLPEDSGEASLELRRRAQLRGDHV